MRVEGQRGFDGRVSQLLLRDLTKLVGSTTGFYLGVRPGTIERDAIRLVAGRSGTAPPSLWGV